MTHILVVEDESIVALDIQSRLQNLGYQVPTTVGNGELAIEQVEATQPDLVLMDIMLQGELDGVQTAERIKERFDVPVIFLTAYSDESTLQRAKNTSPFGYLLKPFNDRELHTTIEIALTKHQGEKDLQNAHDQLELRVEERTAQLAQANEDLQRRFGQMQAIYQLSEDVVRDLASRVLRDYGYEVLEARKGEETLVISELHQGIIHLLLTDVVMPEMSGSELAQELNPLRPDMKVLYMSGYTDDAVVRHGVQESKVPFLQKTFVPDDLVLMVRQVLDN